MLKTATSDWQIASDPTPQFATDAEVAFAQWLRHLLERRYLGESAAIPEVAASEVH